MMIEQNGYQRNNALDLVRFVAIILVLFRHASLDNALSHIGWVGVDLFFVLSGFLVSGLLFKEFKSYGKIRIGRFLVRRALKIYPMFYFFIVVSIIFRYFFAQNPVTVEKILSEIFFLQSYFPGLWDHTWSLAVEEHFYLLLALFIFILLKFNLLNKNSIVLWLFILLMSIPILLRFFHVFNSQEIDYLFQSHLRMDSLFLGVTLSFAHHFYGQFHMIIQKWQKSVLLCGIGLSGIVFCYPAGSVPLNTWAGIIMNIGFGLIVLSAAVYQNNQKLRYNDFLYYPVLIGKYSYGIYLWHLFVKAFFMHFTCDYWQWPYIVISIPIGIFISVLIEKPVLKWRDHKFS